MLNQFSNLIELTDAFPNQESCIKFLEAVIWQYNPACPFCNFDKPYYLEKYKRYRCCNQKCRKQFTVLKGTIFENSKIPLRKWFAAIYLVTAHKKGMSSKQLARDISVTQKSAWFLLHRIRKSLYQTEKPLKGVVECDETYVGGKRRGSKRGRGAQHKVPVFGMVERSGELKAMVVPNVKSKTLHPIILTNIKNSGKKTKLMTDEFKAYNGLKKLYYHQVICHMEKVYAIGEVHTNTIEGFWSWLKRAIKGTHHSTSKKHLQQYIDEFVFKYNFRNLSDSERFVNTIKRCNVRLRYQDLINEPEETQTQKRNRS